MTDVEIKLLELHDIARNNRIRVLYDRLSDEDSFITEFNNNAYIYLDTRLTGINELERFTHETGHAFCGISNENDPEWLQTMYEKRAWNWAATHLVTYRRYSEVMRDPFVDNDIEAAAKLNVSIKILHKARDYYYRIVSHIKSESGVLNESL